MSVKPGSPKDPKIEEFLRYGLSQEARMRCSATGLPLTAEVVREELAKLE